MFKKTLLTVITVLALMTPVFVSAQGLKDAGNILNKVADPSKTGLSKDLGTSVATVIKTILALVGTIFLVLTIYAGVMWMTAQGDESAIEKATGIIKASIIGLVIIMSAYAITYFVTTKLGAVAGTTSPASTQNTTNDSGSPTSNPADSSDPMGCCINNATGADHTPTFVPQSLCPSFQETFTPGPCP